MLIWLFALGWLWGNFAAQPLPPIGIIDFFGLRTVTEAQLRAALPVKEGDPFVTSPAPIERALRAVPGVRAVTVSRVCCDDGGKMILFIGIEEDGAIGLRFRAAPTGKVQLAPEIVRAARAQEKLTQEAVLKGQAGEDEAAGHALSSYPPLRAAQERFIQLAQQHFNQLRNVLRHSSAAEHRAWAAQVLAYTRDKQAVVPDLVDACADPSSGVRNNAMRALAVMAAARLAAPIHVPWEPFINLLSSPVWTDRNKATFALQQVTASRDAALLTQLRQSALPPLLEMARWKSQGHANAALAILGRIAGLSEEVIWRAIAANDRATLLDAARNIR